MALDTELDESVETETSHGINRRTLVKGGLIAGGALWATPVVQILGTRIAAAASLGASYVALVLKFTSDGTTTYLGALVDSAGNITCGIGSGQISNDDSGAGITLWNNLTAGYTLSTSSICPTGLTASVSSTTTTVNLPTGCTLEAYLVHDGQIKQTGLSTDKFYAVPTSPSGNNIGGSGFNLPSVPQIGPTSVLFTKP